MTISREPGASGASPSFSDAPSLSAHNVEARKAAAKRRAAQIGRQKKAARGTGHSGFNGAIGRQGK